MDAYLAKPAYGSKLRTAEFYQIVNSVINVLRPVATLQTIARHLNAQGLQTPSGLSWNKGRLTNYLQSSAAK